MVKLSLGEGKSTVGVNIGDDFPIITLGKVEGSYEVGEDVKHVDHERLVEIEVLNLEGLNVLQKMVSTARKILKNPKHYDYEFMEKQFSLYLEYFLIAKVLESAKNE